MKSGMIVERRDQVLMTCLVPFSFCTSTFARRWSSTNGPFLRLRGILHSLLALVLAGTATTDNELVARLVLTGAALGLAPRADRVATTGGLTLTTTVRVVERVHHDTTDGRALALPAHTAGLAPVDVRLFGVADLTDRGAAANVDATDFAGRHTQRGVGAFLTEQLDAGSGRAGHLRAATRAEFHRVDGRTRRDVAQGQVVAGLDVGAGTGLDRCTLEQALGGDDVALLAVRVVQQGDTRGAVGVVLDVSDLGRHAVLVVATEIDQPVGALVSATLVPGGDTTVCVTSTASVERANQRLLGGRPSDLGEVRDARATTARGSRLVLTDCHESSRPLCLVKSRRLRDRSSEDLDGLAVGREGHERALGVLALAVTEPGPLALALTVGGVDAGHL